MRNRRFLGMAYPITKHPQGFFRNANTDVDEIKSSIATILLTEPQERIFEVHFGTNYKSVHLNAPREMVEGEFRFKIASAIKRWEKRVQVTEIVVKLEEINENLVLMAVVYFIDPTNIKTIHDVTIYKSLGGIQGRKMPF